MTMITNSSSVPRQEGGKLTFLAIAMVGIKGDRLLGKLTAKRIIGCTAIAGKLRLDLP
jgi:hypothetical protein